MARAMGKKFSKQRGMKETRTSWNRQEELDKKRKRAERRAKREAIVEAYKEATKERGERITHENALLLTQLKLDLLQRQLEKMLGEEHTETAFKNITDAEVVRFPQVNTTEEMRELARDIAERTLPELPIEEIGPKEETAEEAGKSTNAAK